MPDTVLNPRRSPRAPIRCAARVALRLDTFAATTVLDYGPGGCQLEAPGRVETGARVYLELVNERVPVRALLTGRVAWCSQAAPWRAGIAFDEDVLTTDAAREFFQRLEEAHPGARDRAFDYVPEDAPLAPTPPQAAIPALSADELRVLRTVGPGMRVDALRAALGERWAACTNPLFALLSRRQLVVGAPDQRAAAEWARVLPAGTK
jgi:hypothetical protein